MADGRRGLGRRGEDAVARWYAERGMVVVARNWRCSGGEIDLVLGAPDGSLVVFCEVKTRTGAAFGSPFEAVTAAKRRRLRRLAGRWMAEGRPEGLVPAQLRVDVAAVHAGPGRAWRIEVVEDAC